jgi:hypothetical protein
MVAYPQTIIPLVASGLIADLAYAQLKPSTARERALRIFAFVVPFTLYALFFAVLISTRGVWWSIHMWAGVPFMAGIVGLLISLVTLPATSQTA